MAAEPAGRRLEGVSGDDPTKRAWAEELVARARREGVELTGDNGVLATVDERRKSPREKWDSTVRQLSAAAPRTPRQ